MRGVTFGVAMIFRFLGYFFMCVALAAMAYDGIRMLADNGQLAFTSVLVHWTMLSPGSLDAVRQGIEGISTYLWSPVAMAVLLLPAWFVAAGLGLLLYLAGYRAPRPALPEGI